MRCVCARKRRRFRGEYRSSCLSRVQEPEDARVCGAFPEAVHARKSSAKPGIGGTLRGQIAGRSRRRRRPSPTTLQVPPVTLGCVFQGDAHGVQTSDCSATVAAGGLGAAPLRSRQLRHDLFGVLPRAEGSSGDTILNSLRVLASGRTWLAKPRGPVSLRSGPRMPARPGVQIRLVAVLREESLPSSRPTLGDVPRDARNDNSRQSRHGPNPREQAYRLN
jgi:hypothetical protein